MKKCVGKKEMSKAIKESEKRDEKRDAKMYKKKAEPLAKGPAARSEKGFAQNIKREKELGKSDKRAVGTAYGEAHLAIDRAKKKYKG